MTNKPSGNPSQGEPPTAVDAVGHVPAYLTSFVGRERELSEVRRLLSEPQVRLLTLTGPGGSGKTRLAVQAATELGKAFEDGVCWVDLAGLADPDLVPQNVILALGLGEAAVASPLDLLSHTLRPRQLLLVLDNCEHLLAACARLIETLLLNAPDLQVLVTSRERLNIPGETTWLVPGLSFPDASTDQASEALITELLRYDAVRLLVERATMALPSFQLTPDNAPAVTEICRRLDGMPLAVELAAARVRVLGIDQIAGRLSDRLDLLIGGTRTAPLRQQTLRATLDWSHDLLSEAEQILFRRLSVFRGTFSLEAAEAVGASDSKLDFLAGAWLGLAGDAILDLLSSLVDKSLIVVERQVGQATYRLLDTIRHYANEKLVRTEESGLIGDAHLRYYHDLAQAAASRLRGPDQQAWVQRLETEHDNFRSALDWAFQACRSGQTQTHCQLAMEMAGSLFWFWNAADHFAEGREWLERAAALPGQEAYQPTFAQVLWAAGTMAWIMGDFSVAGARLEQSLELCRALDDPHGIANALMMLGRIGLYQSDPDGAVRLLQDSADRFRGLGQRHERGQSLAALAAALAMRGDYDDARSAAEEALDIFQALGDTWFTALALGDLGWVTYQQGDLTSAEAYLDEALGLRQQIDAQWLTAQALNYLAEIARYQGAYQRAVGLLEESLALAEDIGARAWIAHGARNLGLVALRQGQCQRATARLLEGLAHYQDLEEQAGIAQSLEGLAAIAADERAWMLAGTLFGAAEQLRETSNFLGTPAERDDLAWVRARLEASLADDVVAHARAEGRQLLLAEALEQARQVPAVLKPKRVDVVPVRHALRVYALGPTQVFRDDRLLVPADWSYAKPRELLFYLASNPPRTKEQIGLVFWPDAAPAQLRRNFRAALYHLRQALGRREWVLFQDGRYAFNRSLDYWYDVEAFERELATARELEGATPARALDALANSASLYRGDFLEDVALDKWALLRREELREAFLAALVTQGRLLFDGQEYDQAAEVYRTMLAHDNLMESAHRALMRCYARLGRRNMALRHYKDLVTLLRDELSVPPAPETAALFERLKAGQDI